MRECFHLKIYVIIVFAVSLSSECWGKRNKATATRYSLQYLSVKMEIKIEKRAKKIVLIRLFPEFSSSSSSSSFHCLFITPLLLVVYICCISDDKNILYVYGYALKDISVYGAFENPIKKRHTAKRKCF